MTLGGSCGIIVICMCVRMRKRLTEQVHVALG